VEFGKQQSPNGTHISDPHQYNAGDHNSSQTSSSFNHSVQHRPFNILFGLILINLSRPSSTLVGASASSFLS
jgi:hypothetical protein